MAELQTEVRIGFTEGYRYIGVRPPLSDEEIGQLRERRVLSGAIEQIDGDSACTLLVTTAGGADFNEHTKRTVRTAEQLTETLRLIRPGAAAVALTTQMVGMSGPGSTPFNPDTRTWREPEHFH